MNADNPIIGAVSSEGRAAGEQTDVRGCGVMTISPCDEEKLFAVVKSIQVRGRVICSDSIRAHYGLK